MCACEINFPWHRPAGQILCTCRKRRGSSVCMSSSSAGALSLFLPATRSALSRCQTHHKLHTHSPKKKTFIQLTVKLAMHPFGRKAHFFDQHQTLLRGEGDEKKCINLLVRVFENTLGCSRRWALNERWRHFLSLSLSELIGRQRPTKKSAVNLASSRRATLR